MAFRFLTIVFFFDMDRAPLERLAVTIIGSISGVSPTATEMAKMKASNQSPFVNPLMKNTNGTMTSIKRMSSRLTLLIPLSKAVVGTVSREVVGDSTEESPVAGFKYDTFGLRH